MVELCVGEATSSCSTLIGGQMRTKEEIEAAFVADLRQLLLKYGAELSAEDHWRGYAECGSDVRMNVYIPGVYDDNGDTISERCEIDLGASFDP